MANQQLPPPRRRGDHLFERWGVKLLEDGNGVVSSGLIPIFPSLHQPFGLTEDLWWTHKRALQEAATRTNPMPKSLPKPTGVQLDELFFTERWQQTALNGVRTWELSSLNQGIIGTSYWQEVLMADLSILPIPDITVTVEQFPDIDLVNVDESKWNKVFGRGRWYDLRGVVLETDANGNPTNTRDWSVDDDAIWDGLRTVIEMANRILHHVIYGDWLYALLEGTVAPISNVMPFVPGSNDYFNMPKRMFSPGENGSGGLKQPDQRVAQRLWHQIESLSEWIIWSFFDPRDVDKYGSVSKTGVTAGYCDSAMSRTMMEKPCDPRTLPSPGDPDIFTDIKINTMLLESVLNVSNTPEEVAAKHTTRLQLALVMVHELMHALYQARVYVNSGRGTWEHEPTYQDENSVELGWSQEHSLLGTVRTIGPINVFMPDSEFLSRAGPAFTVASSWLNDPRQREKGKELTDMNNGMPRGLPERSMVQLGPLPTYWCSRFQSQSFWDAHVAAYGLGALKAGPVVTSHSRYYNAAHMRTYHARKHVQPGLSRHQPIPPGQLQRFRLEEEQTYQYMEFRRKLWKSLRPWYKQSYRLWQKTPYSFGYLRLLIDRFRQAVEERKRTDAEVILGTYSGYLAVLARDMSTPYPVPHPAPPNVNALWYFEFDRHPALWPFVMLEIMMHASLPYDWLIALRKQAAPPPPPPPPPQRTASKRRRPPGPPKEYLQNRWFPSRHAQAAGTFFRYPPYWSRDKDPGPPKPAPGTLNADVTDPGRIFKPMFSLEMAKPDRLAPWPSPSRISSLYHARWSMLCAVESPRIRSPMQKYPVHKKVWQALIAQYKSLVLQNKQLGNSNSNGQWLDFNFSFPAYDETDQFVVLDRFIRPMPPGQWARSGFSGKDWYEQGYADPDKLTVAMRMAGEPHDLPEVYLPSEDEGDGDQPEVWQRWWPVVNPPPAGDVDMMDVTP
ncbi:hypothetical protein SMACR_08647 [Sordaria macrospora]|uniref:WGS project CABT00000000 data, contig 2.61 n=2 Tax=Sordaria macrospora TaxID=5147 RepID=F7WAG7_SORMK|nr:uncharacterized protein SMAC_08647 [Sordaria macrospora k-hell]KAA8629711.1 hypothetical protein SMACR_08647 [Sordaria macrospora]WPJ65221.1 hypothetical protein SMAC4_08647 [Sordaria macrospora]CCC05332.1 unnamed protein product [Sordaria macrospora k-hell]